MNSPTKETEKKEYTRDQKAVFNKYGKLQKGSNDKMQSSTDFFKNLNKRIKQANR